MLVLMILRKSSMPGQRITTIPTTTRRLIRSPVFGIIKNRRNSECLGLKYSAFLRCGLGVRSYRLENEFRVKGFEFRGKKV
jgi:hypothetical protein